MKKFHAQVKMLCSIYCKFLFKKKEAKTKHQVLNPLLLPLYLAKRNGWLLLKLSQSSPLVFLALYVDSFYFLICVASELL